MKKQIYTFLGRMIRHQRNDRILGPIVLSWFEDCDGKKILLFGENHKNIPCVNDNVSGLHMYLLNMFATKECFDFFIEDLSAEMVRNLYMKNKQIIQQSRYNDKTSGGMAHWESRYEQLLKYIYDFDISVDHGGSIEYLKNMIIKNNFNNVRLHQTDIRRLQFFSLFILHILHNNKNFILPDMADADNVVDTFFKLLEKLTLDEEALITFYSCMHNADNASEKKFRTYIKQIIDYCVKHEIEFDMSYNLLPENFEIYQRRYKVYLNMKDKIYKQKVEFCKLYPHLKQKMEKVIKEEIVHIIQNVKNKFDLITALDTFMVDIYTFLRMFRKFDITKHHSKPLCGPKQNNVICYFGATHTVNVIMLIERIFECKPYIQLWDKNMFPYINFKTLPLSLKQFLKPQRYRMPSSRLG